jgi:hypothetical protein
MVHFQVGDHVRWVQSVVRPEFKNPSGIVKMVIPNDNELFAQYDVEFDFGICTLYSSHLELEEKSQRSNNSSLPAA